MLPFFWQWRVDRLPLPGWLFGFGWNSHGPFPTRFPRWLASFSEVDSSGLCMAMHNRLSSLECSVTIVYVSQVLHTWTEKARVFDTEFSGWRARWALPASQDKRCLGDWKDSPENTVPKCPKDIDDFWTEPCFGRFSHTWKGDGSTTVVWMVRVILMAMEENHTTVSSQRCNFSPFSHLKIWIALRMLYLHL